MPRLTAALISAVLVLTPQTTILTSPAHATDDPYLDAVTADAPVAFWRMDETGNAVVLDDATSAGRNGAYVGAPTQEKPGAIPAEPGTAVGFNGSTQHATVPAAGAFATTRASVELWFRTTTKSSNRYLYNRGGSSGQTVVSLDSTGKLTGAVRVNGTRYSVTTTNDLTEGRWHHVVLTYDGTAAVLYVDGVSVGSAAATGNLDAFATSGPNLAGISNGTVKYLGDLDEVAVYDVALSSAQVAAHHEAAGVASRTCQATTPYQEAVCGSDPVAYYPLDTSDMIAHDSVAPSADGVYLQGGASATGGVYTEPTRSAARLDGNDDHISVSYDPYGRFATAKASAETWLRTRKHHSYDAFAVSRGTYSGGPFGIGVRNGFGFLRAFVNGTAYNLVGFTKIDDRAWHHVAFTYDGTYLRLYVDGIEENTAIAVGSLPHATSFGPDIGGIHGSTGTFGGDIDEVAIYDRPLAADEIAARVAAAGDRPYSCVGTGAYGSFVCDSQPVGYWPLNDSVGSTTAADATSYANAATPQNGWRFGRWGVADSAGGIPDDTSSPRLVLNRDDYGAYAFTTFSVEGWARTTGTPSPSDGWFVTAVGGTLRWAIGLQPVTGNLMGEILTADNVRHRLTSNVALGPAFSHVALTYDGAVMRLYGNGEVIAQKVYAGTVPRCYDAAPCAYALGVPTNTAGAGWPEIDLDEVALYGRGLSEAEVINHVLTGVENAVDPEQTFGPTGSGDYAENPTGCCGDPVNTGSGSFFGTWQDLKLGGAGITFQMSRSYNSNDPTVGTLGKGWTHPYESRLTVATNGDVEARVASGQRLSFTKQANGSYTGARGTRATLVKDASSYVLTTRTQERLTFDLSGRLQSHVDRSGVGLTMTYTGSDLTEVTDAAGRTVTFTYNAGRLETVTLPDGRYAAYGYDGDGQPSTARDAEGNVTSYLHDSGLRLTTATQGTRTLFSNTYDGTTGRLTSQLDALGHETTFGWDPVTRVATITNDRGGVAKHFYSAGGVLLRRENEVGAATKYVYDDDLNVVAVIDARGFQTTMTYDAAGNLLTRKAPPPLNYVETFTYTARNDVATTTDARNHTTTYGYDTAGRLTSIVDAANDTTTFTYNSDGQVETITEPGSRITTFTYDTAGNVETRQSPAGLVTTYDHDTSGRVTTVTPPAQGTTTYVYNDADQVEVELAPENRNTYTTFDIYGRVSMVSRGDETVEYTYDDADHVLETRLNGELAVTTEYDEVGNVTATESRLGRRTTYTYDLANRLVTTTSPRGNEPGAVPASFTTTFKYDLTGNRTHVTHPAAGTTRTAYDALNRPTSTTNALGHTASVAYDANGNVTTPTNELGKSVTMTYDVLDRLATTTNEVGKTTTFDYDDAGNLNSLTTPLGHTRTWDHDLDGRITAMVDPRGDTNPGAYTTTYAYDDVDRKTVVTDPLGNDTTHEFDLAGRRVAVEDGNGHRTTFAYDANDRLVTVTSPDLKVTTYVYGDNGHVEGRYDGRNNLTSFGYDLDGRLVTMTEPQNRVTNYTYDADGNVTKRETPLGTATSTVGDGTVDAQYDALGRTTLLDYSDATPDVSMTYDALGRLKTMSDGLGSGSSAQTYAYDLAGRLKTMKRASATFTFAYDDAGRLTSRTYPNGTQTTQSYDDDGRVASTTTSSLTTTYDYDEADNLVETRSPLAHGDVVESRVYDNAGHLTEIASYTGGTTLSERQEIERDPVGNVVTRTVDRDGSVASTTFAYDVADRLLKACYATSCNIADSYVEYEYDGVGNRTAEWRVTPNGTRDTTFAYDDSDRLLSSTTVEDGLTQYSTSYSHDANGRMTAAGARTFTWGLDDRLVSTTLGTTTQGYTYDGAGRRATAATNGNVHTRYAWDLSGGLPMIATESDASGSTFRDFLFGPAGVVATRDAVGETSYLTHDPTGNVTSVFDDTGTATWRYAYDPFGEVRSSVQLVPSAAGSPLLFASEPLDTQTGLYHLRARQLDPSLGRMLSPDPVMPAATDQSVSAYAYVANRPTLLTDPSGLNAFSDVFSAVGGGLKDAAGDIYASLDTLVTNPTQIQRNLEQVYIENGRGWSGRLAIVNQFNPAYHVLTNGDAYVNAVECGDLRGATRYATHTVLSAMPLAQGTLGTLRIGNRTALVTRLSRRLEAARAEMRLNPERGSFGRGPLYLNRGSTGRATPVDLTEQLLREKALANPAEGSEVQLATPMGDTRWPATDVWIKMEMTVGNRTIHYVYNAGLNAVDDIKFMNPPRYGFSGR